MRMPRFEHVISPANEAHETPSVNCTFTKSWQEKPCSHDGFSPFGIHHYHPPDEGWDQAACRLSTFNITDR
jgi:hypothetical protein